MERPLLSVIGGGAMGSALLRRWVAAGVYPAAQVALREPDPDKANTLQQELGIRLLADLAQAGESEILFLAVKPQVFPQVVAS